MDLIQRAASAPGRLTLMLACQLATIGVAMPFLGRWLSETHHLTGAQISAILAAPLLARLLVGIPLAAWADAQADRRTPLIAFTLCAFALYCVFFAVSSFALLLAFYLLAHSSLQSAMPLSEGQLLRASVETRLIPFGIARGMASSAFLAAAIGSGVALEALGIRAAPGLVLAGVGASALAALFWVLPDRQIVATTPFLERLHDGGRLLRVGGFGLVVLAAGLVQGSHGFYYAISGIEWERVGYGSNVIGALWAVGVVAEIGFLVALPLIEPRMSPVALMILGGIGGVVRWGVMALSPPLWLLFPLQGLHALTFAAAHVGAIRLAMAAGGQTAPAMAQTLYAAISAGVCVGVGMLLAGELYDRVGALAVLAMALSSGAGALLIAASRKRLAETSQDR